MLQRHVFGQLVAKVLGHAVVLGQGTVIRRGRGKAHVWTQVVFALLAAVAAAAGHAGLHRDPVAYFEVLDAGPDLVYNSRRLVAQHHGCFDDELADRAVRPVVYVRATYSGVLYFDDAVFGKLELGDGAVFESDRVGLFEDEGWVLIESKSAPILPVYGYGLLSADELRYLAQRMLSAVKWSASVLLFTVLTLTDMCRFVWWGSDGGVEILLLAVVTYLVCAHCDCSFLSARIRVSVKYSIVSTGK